MNVLTWTDPPDEPPAFRDEAVDILVLQARAALNVTAGYDDDGRITVNGVPLNEQAYLAEGQKPSSIEFEVEVADGYLWVQGDNRANSADSRVHLGDPGGGQVPVADVVGKVFAVVWPFDHVKLTERPATFEGMG